MTTFIKTKFKISDDQTNIDKYRLAANIEKGREERKGHPFFFVKCVFPIKKNIS